MDKKIKTKFIVTTSILSAILLSLFFLYFILSKTIFRGDYTDGEAFGLYSQSNSMMYLIIITLYITSFIITIGVNISLSYQYCLEYGYKEYFKKNLSIIIINIILIIGTVIIILFLQNQIIDFINLFDNYPGFRP